MHRAKAVCRRISADPADIERGVRQRLADKVSGTMMGVWLLIPEYLRLGVWDLLRGWTGSSNGSAPRLALQLVNEAALGVSGVRQKRCLSQKGFELANGLPFVTTDTDIHHLLSNHTVADTMDLQSALGRVRYASGHFRGTTLAIDPHRMLSASKRQMARKAPKANLPSTKLSQLFFCLDADTQQPLCCTLASSSLAVSRATPELISLVDTILPPSFGEKPLLLGDAEHFSVSLFDQIARADRYDLLVPMPRQSYYKDFLRSIPDSAFNHRWAGYATATVPFAFKDTSCQSLWCIAQRTGERSDSYLYKGFICTSCRDEVSVLTHLFPERWHIEEFFNLYQDLGWKKAGTLNINIRYGKVAMALIAQAAISQLRTHLPNTSARWSTDHLARLFFQGIDGDLRVQRDTIIVTLYNAPHSAKLASQYTNLPERLCSEGIDPRIPWLYNFKLNFRFR